MKLLDAATLDLTAHVRAGDGVIWGQVAGEAQSPPIGPVASRAPPIRSTTSPMATYSCGSMSGRWWPTSSR